MNQSSASYFKLLCLAIVAFLSCWCHHQQAGVMADQMSLAAIMPKLEAIYEDASSLLLKNAELKNQILVGLQAQNEAKLKQVRDLKLLKPGMKPPVVANAPAIDFVELEDFNKWVDANLEYAVKNTQGSIEALKEEAAQNNGTVDYTEQAIKDGIEGVRYWQQAVIFQDKTLNNEKFDQGESQ